MATRLDRRRSTDAIVVKVRDGQVANRPVYAAIGVTLGGEKDILGLWAGTGGEGAKFWMSVLTDLKNRGVKDVFFVVCDGLGHQVTLEPLQQRLGRRHRLRLRRGHHAQPAQVAKQRLQRVRRLVARIASSPAS